MKQKRDKKFLVFKKECERLIKEWGLDDWDVSIKTTKDTSVSMYAYLDACVGNGTATIYYNPIGHKNVGISEVIDSARHEMIHLLLAKLAGLGCSRFTSEREINREEECLNNKLKRIIFEK